jgi:hypothetical protein
MTRPATYLRVHKRKQWEQEQGSKPADAKQPVTVIIRRKRGKQLRATEEATEPDADPKGRTRSPPLRHWRCYGDDPLPIGQEALDETLSAFPSWYLRIR